MKSLRSQITTLTMIAVLVCTVLIGAISILSMKSQGDVSSGRLMNEVCKEKCEHIDTYLASIEESAKTVSRFVYDSTDSEMLADTGVLGATGAGASESGSEKIGDQKVDADRTKARFDVLNRTPEQVQRLDRYLKKQQEEVRLLLGSIAQNESSVYSYYYRINPEFGGKSQGFWYVWRVNGFMEQKLTDISKYDPDDMAHVGWYYEPLRRDRASWLIPYENENLGANITSYAIPVYKAGTFIGIVGIDIRFSSLVKEVKNLTVMETGYGFLTDADGRIVYHPDLEAGTQIEDVIGDLEEVDTEEKSSGLVTYTYRDKKRNAAWGTLSNGLRLVITVPEEEIDTGWRSIAVVILMFGLMLLGCFGLITVVMMHRITRPLERLVLASRQISEGDYDVKLTYRGNDEVGELTAAFSQMADQMKGFIRDLNSRAYKDALTSVSNKGAFGRYVGDLDEKIRSAEPGSEPPFAIAVFDCNDLKFINDTYGHDKGDIYIQSACRLICKVFAHSPVFRIGGDEFAVILRGDDFENRETLEKQFIERAGQTCSETADPWVQIRMAKGIAVYDPKEDNGTGTVLRRADEAMYRDKRETKGSNQRNT